MQTSQAWVVLKFGGTSVSSAGNWHNIAEVVRARSAASLRPVIVHSALSGITDQLLRAFAEEKDVKAGILINGSRVALTGQGVAPSLFAVMAALGKDRVVRRLKAASEIAVVAQGLS